MNLSSSLPSLPSVKSRQLVFQLGSGAPLFPLEAVYALRGISAEEAESLVVQGGLGLCFDIKMPGAARAEIRVLRNCLHGERPTLDEALEIILGHSSNNPTIHQSIHPSIRAKWLARRWCCSPSHIINLIDAGELKTIGTPAHIKASPHVTRASAETFLRSRVEGQYPELHINTSLQGGAIKSRL